MAVQDHCFEIWKWFGEDDIHDVLPVGVEIHLSNASYVDVLVETNGLQLLDAEHVLDCLREACSPPIFVDVKRKDMVRCKGNRSPPSTCPEEELDVVVEKVRVETYVVADEEWPVTHSILSLEVGNAHHVPLTLRLSFLPDPVGSVDKPTRPSRASLAPYLILPGFVKAIRNRVLDGLELDELPVARVALLDRNAKCPSRSHGRELRPVGRVSCLSWPKD